MKVLGAFVKPKGMIIHLYRPSLVLKVAFHLSLNANLMVATLQNNLREDGGSKHHVQHVIQSGNGESTFNGDLIDSATINAYSPRIVFLWS